ncbi:cytochrome C assembly family protein [Colwellia echini]|uniref:Cytochrome C assembly family protein n=1 Tax=Colwellia echini TaxID=1982103 RepID=A0ABY3MU94_9GAMM|nr:cytochrome c biogenesis protein CcsA [Colwellia echini]TYK64755.1 cytochrome C assembly family protein [Colwellia echini]
MDFLVIGSSLDFLLYLLATLAVVTRLFHPEGPNNKLVLGLACAAILVHAALLFSQQTLNFNLPHVVSLVSLTITIVVTLVALKFKVNLLLPVIYGFTGLWQLVIIFLPPIDSIPLVNSKFVLLSHISLALVAYSILIIATLFAFQVTYINVKLKSKNLAAVAHLPPLMQVETQLFKILTLGTVILFISEVIGFAFLDGFLAKANAHKTLLSLLALSIYSVILWGHFVKGWRGHRVLVLMLTASGLLTLAYFGSRLVKEFIL